MRHIKFNDGKPIKISDITVTNEAYEFSSHSTFPSLRLYKAHVISVYLELDDKRITEHKPRRVSDPPLFYTIEFDIETTGKSIYTITVKFDKDKVGVNPTNKTFTGLVNKLFNLNIGIESTEPTKETKVPCEDLLSIEAPQ